MAVCINTGKYNDKLTQGKEYEVRDYIHLVDTDEFMIQILNDTQGIQLYPEYLFSFSESERGNCTLIGD